MVGITEKIEKIAKKKSSLLELEKKLKLQEREREKRKRIKQSEAVGKLAYRVGIDLLDQHILLGAFLEIAEKEKDKDQIAKWMEKAKEYITTQNREQTSRLCITFTSAVSAETKQKLAELGFVWNKFRKEFYGHATQKQLDEALAGLEYKIEELT